MAGNEPVILTPEAARILVSSLPMRRLRVAHRGYLPVYSVLLALEECAVMSGAGQNIAIGNGPADDRRMTVLQAARRARVSARTIVRAVHDGHLDADRFGPVWQISERSLASYIAARESGGKRLKERTMA